MSGNINKSPTEWRNYSTKIPIAAFRLQREDLKRLYKIINDKQIEFRERMMGILALQPEETEDAFNARKIKVFNAFVTSVTINGTNGEMVHGNNEEFLDSTNMPDQIRSVLFSTQSVPAAVLGFSPICNVVAYLDFSRPPLLDFSQMPTLATRNESNFAVAADEESWFTATSTRLKEFFATRKTRSDWLHRPAVYDVLLIFLGIPIAIWAANKVGNVAEKIGNLSSIILSSVYVYSFILSLVLFRVLFSYSRWVFPKVEIASEISSSPFRHRTVWLAIIIAVAGSILYDLCKFLFVNS